MDEIERQFWAHWEGKGKPEIKSIGGMFMNFAKTKYRQALGR